MRRLRDAGIVTMLLLGLTGCAGVQQRLGWTEPPYQGDEDIRGTPPVPAGVLAPASGRGDAAAVGQSAEAGRPTVIAGNGTSRPTSRRTGPASSVACRWWASLEGPGPRRFRTCPRCPPCGMPRRPRTPATVARPARRVRPPGSPASSVSIRESAVLVRPGPGRQPAAPRAPKAEPVRELSVDLAGTKPQVDSAAVPVARSTAPTRRPRSRRRRPSTSPNPATQEGTTPPPPVVLSRSGTSSTPIASPGARPDASAPDLAPVTNRGPTPAVPDDRGARMSARVGLVDADGDLLRPARCGRSAAPRRRSPAPASRMSRTSSQGSYVSSGCTDVLRDALQGPQALPVQEAQASGVRLLAVRRPRESPCESTPCKVKKPCFLKTWLHHKSGCKSKGCKGCKSCSYCGEPASMVSVQSPIVSSQF